jgi:hypothetical protein
LQLLQTMSDSDPTQDEREELAARFRAEFEEEHTERQLAQQRRRDRAKTRANEKQERRQALVESEVQDQVRAEFYKEKGYQLYTDSAGREHWLTPEEYEWRMRARAQREQRRRTYQPSLWVRKRTMVLYAGAVALAIVVGLFLVT